MRSRTSQCNAWRKLIVSPSCDSLISDLPFYSDQKIKAVAPLVQITIDVCVWKKDVSHRTLHLYLEIFNRNMFIIVLWFNFIAYHCQSGVVNLDLFPLYHTTIQKIILEDHSLKKQRDYSRCSIVTVVQ